MTAYPIMLSASPGTLQLNQQIPDTVNGGVHPHLIDMYTPNGTIRAVIILHHGAAGTKEVYSQQMGIHTGPVPTLQSVDWGALQSFGVAVWVPQGFYCIACPAPGCNQGTFNPNNVTAVASSRGPVFTWLNHVEYSGVDDVGFEADVPAAMQAKYGSTLRIMGGHSNGGMFTQRRWYEHVAGQYNVYCMSSGPASQYFVSNPTTPAIVKPTISILGLQDDILRPVDPANHFFDALWGPSERSVADVTEPTNWIGEFIQFQARVNAYNAFKGLAAETVSPTVDGVKVTLVNLNGPLNPAAGTMTVWTYSGGANVMMLLSACDHHVRTMQKDLINLPSLNTVFGQFMGFAFQNANG